MRLIDEEQRWFDATLQDVFGYHAVQIGPSSLDALRANRMSCRARMVWQVGHPPPIMSPRDGAMAGAGKAADAPSEAGEGSRPCHLEAPNVIVGSIEDLPLLTESIDLLVLPHTMEVSADPHRLLREAQRVLIPEGRLVITGFNPWSLWRLRRASLPGRSSASGHAWISLPRLKDWLKLLNFDLGAGGASAFGAYVPPVQTDAWHARLGWMDPAGRRWWPMAGGAYFLMAVKRVHHVQLIGAAWRDQRASPRRAAAASPIGRAGGTGESCP
jgi:SAM-dependent methyltransferase